MIRKAEGRFTRLLCDENRQYRIDSRRLWSAVAHNHDPSAAKRNSAIALRSCQLTQLRGDVFQGRVFKHHKLLTIVFHAWGLIE